MSASAPTLAYDAAVMGDGAPPPLLREVRATTLVLAGGASPEWMRESARAAAEAIPGARFEVLEGQTHDVAADVLAAAPSGRARVITGFSLVCLNVLDLDQAT